MKIKIIALVMLIALIVGCSSATPTTSVSTPAGHQSTVIAPTGYRPVQAGDVIEGATISYQYVLPSADKPTVVLAFSSNLLQLFSVRPDLSNGLVAYIRELPADKPVFMFDENNPKQTEPQLMSWDASKPIEIVYVILTEEKHSWSVTESQGLETQAAYKIVRRKDGGLRFIDAYGIIALQSANTMSTQNLGISGLMFSARLALLKTILTTQRYQRGANVMTMIPPSPEQYDPRILKLDPSQTGLAQNKDWAITSRKGPAIGNTSE